MKHQKLKNLSLLKNSASFEKAIFIVKKIKQAGFEAVFAGGAIRDVLLALSPLDIDIATSASAEQVCKLFENSQIIGKSFSVALIKGNGKAIEVASFRTDGPYSDGRRPDWTKPANMKEDANRRDFTINGMFFDPIKNQLIDYVGGIYDLEQKKLKCIGEAKTRFSEDYLRLFRAIRFASRLNFEIDLNTSEAIKTLAPNTSKLAAERVRDELERMLLHEQRKAAINLLCDYGLLDYWLPELPKLIGVLQQADFHPEGDVFAHTMLALENIQNPSRTLAWATLLHDIGKPASKGKKKGRITFYGHDLRGAKIADKILNRLHLPKAQIKQITSLIANHMRFLNYLDMKKSTKKKFMSLENFDELLHLHKADILASSLDLTIHDRIVKDMKHNKHLLPPPLIDGDDLLKLGYKQDIRLGKVLQEIRNLQLDEKLDSKASALKHAKQRLGK